MLKNGDVIFDKFFVIISIHILRNPSLLIFGVIIFIISSHELTELFCNFINALIRPL